MNKLIKGAVAGTAGIALLLGGAGTFALWNDSTTVAGGTITSGQLDIANQTAGVWKNGAATIDIATYKVVPGDVLTYTTTFDAIATGNTLKATLALGDNAITPTTPADPEDIALASFLTDSATATATGLTGTAPNYEVAVGTNTVTVTATITFANGVAGAENGAMLGSVNLSGFNITLTQHL